MITSRSKQSVLFTFAIPFLVLFLLFCLLRHDLFQGEPVVAVEDFAANELLIAKAKSFELLHGNYSRVGFYHPGPFFLQVMALFETVLHDWTHAIGSPAVTAVIAGLFLHALALATLYWAFVRYFQDIPQALLAALVTVVVASLIIDTNAFYSGQLFFTTSWPPFLYMAATILLQAGIIAIVAGAAAGIPLTTAALMILIHGHASFIGLVPMIVLSLAVCAMIQAGRRDGVSVFGTIGTYTRNNRSAIIISAGIVLLFSAPIILNTIRNWPGEIPKYFSFAGERTAPPALDLLRYWTTFAHWSLLAIPAFILVSSVEKHDMSKKLVLLCLAAIIPASVFYSLRGLDTLEYKYPLFWMAPTFGVAAAISAIEFMRTASRPAYRKAWAVFLVLFAIFGFSKFKPHGIFEFIPETETRRLHEGLRQVPHQGRLVLDLDMTQDPGVIWSSMLSLQAYGKQQEALFCLNQGWHISNTYAARCTPDEVASGQHYGVRKLAQGPEAPVAQGMGIGIYAFRKPDLSTTGELTVAAHRDMMKSFVLGSGWSEIEEQFVWSQGSEARLTLHAAPGFAGTAELDLGSFIPAPDADQILTIVSGTTRAGPFRFSWTDQRKRIRFPISVDSGGSAAVTLHIDHPVSPKQAGLSEDPRVLGVALYGIKLEKQ